MKRAGRYLTAKAGWHEIGGQRVYFRSKAELHHAQWLQLMIAAGRVAKWEHEPEWFEFPIQHGTTRYLPDFRVTLPDGTVEYHEVKGWLDRKSQTQLRRMAKYHPDVIVKLFGAKLPEKTRKSSKVDNRPATRHVSGDGERFRRESRED